MKRKHWFIVAGGLLTFLIVFTLGFSWSNSSEQSTAEWWQDVAEIRSSRDFVEVVSGRRSERRRWLEVAIVDLGTSIILSGESSKGATIAPMFGGTPSRNMVNTIDKNIPTEWNVEEGKRKNIKWAAELGTYTYSSPVIADGKVFIGTNNYNPRDPADQAFIKKNPAKSKTVQDKAVLMAFNEADGKFLWQLVHDMVEDAEYRYFGLVASPTVEGKRLYYITPACVFVCASTDGKIQWSFDLMKELNVSPFHCAASSPLVVGDLVMVITGNGVDVEEKIRSPKAPSFVAFNKNTGKLAWQSNLPGEDIIEGQWSNATLATVNGKPQVIFGGGDCVLYSLEPQTGEVIWKCNCNPTRKNKRKDGRSIENYITATPVVVGDQLFVGLGPMPAHDSKKSSSYFLCLDITKKGDVSLKSYEANDAANKESALVWAFGGPIMPPPAKGRPVYSGVICGTAAVLDGLVYVTEDSGYMHCLDANTGKEYWDHDFKDTVWGSPYYVDGKVYVASEGGDLCIFKHGKDRIYYADGKPQVDAKDNDRKVRPAVSMDEAIYGTPVVAGGTMFIATKLKLYAIR